MLGIFQTKKKEYNELILKSLVLGAKTTNQIGKYVQSNRKGKPKNLKTIVSIISRKRSRLDELETKGYISRNRKDNLWNLTFKGFGVALTFYYRLEPIYPQVKPFLHSFVEYFMEQIRKNPTLPKFYLFPEFVQTMTKLCESLEFLQMYKDLISELIKQGSDLDQMSKEAFFTLFASRSLSVYIPKFFGLSY